MQIELTTESYSGERNHFGWSREYVLLSLARQVRVLRCLLQTIILPILLRHLCYHNSSIFLQILPIIALTTWTQEKDNFLILGTQRVTEPNEWKNDWESKKDTKDTKDAKDAKASCPKLYARTAHAYATTAALYTWKQHQTINAPPPAPVLTFWVTSSSLHLLKLIMSLLASLSPSDHDSTHETASNPQTSQTPLHSFWQIWRLSFLHRLLSQPLCYAINMILLCKVIASPYDYFAHQEPQSDHHICS